MRSLTTLFAASALLMSIGCGATPTATDHAANGTSVEADARIETETATLTVHGMGCPLCANNVDRQLERVPGVTEVSIDMGSGHVVVTLDPEQPPTRRQLAQAISDSGFTLVRLDTP